MTGIATNYNQNLTSDKKPTDIVEKDIRKWVESVVEFKAKLDQKKNEAPLEKHLQKNKKFKSKARSSAGKVSVGDTKPSVQMKSSKGKKIVKKNSKQTAEKTVEKNEKNETADLFEAVKDSYRTLKLPANWTSGISNNRIVFNRIKISTHNAQQKMTVERSLVITKDCTVHILINGSEINLPNWETHKLTAIEDIKKAIKDIDSLKVCEGSSSGVKGSLCSELVDSKMKVCDACKSNGSSPPKPIKKKQKITKKSSVSKEVTKQKSVKK